MSLTILDQESPRERERTETLIERLRGEATGTRAVAETVADVIDAVRSEGDDAVARAMRQWSDPRFSPEHIRVPAERLAAADRELDPAVRDAFDSAIEHIRAYQRHTRPADPPPVTIGRAELGLRHRPVDAAGLHVPGGQAAYPSTALMLAVPAEVAGVPRPCVVSPPPNRQEGEVEISPLVLAACHRLGVEEVYRIGGAQAIAALAYGTESVPAVDMVAGPGNPYVQEAKKQVFGRVGIDGLFGPSEVLVVADETAEPRRVAAELLAQAEHDPGCGFLVTTRREVAERVTEEVQRQLPDRKRRDAIQAALRDWSAAFVVPDDEAAATLVDRIAAEHVLLAVAEPEKTLGQVRHGGAWFLGEQTPVASGDYQAGPSHCLPTGTTARWCSGLSAHTFLKQSSVERYPDGLDDATARAIATLAEAEGLEAHAHAARLRRGHDA